MSFKKHVDFDPELEEKVIGIFLWEPSTYSQVYNIIRDECFHEKKNLEYFRAIKYVYDAGYTVDYLLVQRVFFDKEITEINGENIPYLTTQYMSGVYSSANLQTWCIYLRELAAKRMMTILKNSGKPNGDIFEEAGEIERKLKDIMDVRVSDDWVHISSVMVKLMKHMESMKDNEMPGISTTIKEMDAINGGFRPGQLIVIGARPGVGKSAFMGRIAVRAAANGKHVGIISLEMEDKDIAARSVSAESDIPFWRIDRAKFDINQEAEQTRLVYQTMSDMGSLPIHFSDNTQVNIHDIRAKAEKLKSKKQLDILIIDYLQLIESENPYAKNTIREQEIAKMSRGLKLLAMKLQIPVIILAQLNRGSETAKDKKPELHNLRESGAIEQDADIVFFLHRDWKSGIKQNEHGETTEFEADILNRKWRNGKEIDVKMGFDGDKMKFYDLPPKTFYSQAPSQQQQQNNQNTSVNNNSFDDIPF